MQSTFNWLVGYTQNAMVPARTNQPQDIPAKLLGQPIDSVNLIFAACDLQTFGRLTSTCKYLRNKISLNRILQPQLSLNSQQNTILTAIIEPVFSKFLLDTNLLSNIQSKHAAHSEEVKAKYKTQILEMAKSLPRFSYALQVSCYEALVSNPNFKARYEYKQVFEWQIGLCQAYAKWAAQGDMAAKEWLEAKLIAVEEFDARKVWYLLGIGQYYLHFKQSEAAKTYFQEAHQLLTTRINYGETRAIKLLGSPEISKLMKEQLNVDTQKQLSDLLETKTAGCSFDLDQNDSQWICNVFCYSEQLPEVYEKERLSILMRICHTMTDPFDIGRTENSKYDHIRNIMAEKIRLLAKDSLPDLSFFASSLRQGELLIKLNQDIAENTPLAPFFKKEHGRHENCLFINQANFNAFKKLIFRSS